MKKPDKSSDRFALFSRVREGMAADLEVLLDAALPAIANDIESAAQAGMLTIQEQRQLYSAAATLRIDRGSRVKRARTTFNERALRCLELSVDQSSSKAALSLLEEDELEVQILGADIAAKLREREPALCLGFAKRVEVTTDRQWRSEDLQPLGPRTLGSAVAAALRALADAPAAKREVKTITLARLGDALATLMTSANQRLIDAGILADWTPEVEKQPESAKPAESAADSSPLPGMSIPSVWPPLPRVPTEPEAAPVPEPPTASEASPSAGFPEIAEAAQLAEQAVPSQATAAEPPRAVAITELAADVSRKLDRSPLAAQDGRGKLRVLPTLQPVVDIERDAVAFAHSIGTVPYSRESRREFFGNVRKRLEGASASAAQVSTVEIVGAMFDYVVDDRRLPEPAKPLFWRLQQPAVALSLLDPGYLSNEPRSLRRLIENFGAIATAYSDEFVKGGELHRRLETVVRAVEIVSSALQTRSAVISQQVDREYGRAIKSVTQLVDRVVNERTTLESTPVRQNRRDYRNRPSKQRETEVSDRLRTLLEERINKHQVPDSAREFILNVWLRHLRTAVLRDGEDSTEFKLALEVVDDLLWSLDNGKGTQSRSALVKRIPPLIRLLTSGLKEIGAREEEQKGFFDELFLVHLRKMRRVGPAGQGETDFTELSPLTSLPTLDEAIVDADSPARPAAGGREPAGAGAGRSAERPAARADTPAEAAQANAPAAAGGTQVVPPQTPLPAAAPRATPAVPIFVPGEAGSVLAEAGSTAGADAGLSAAAGATVADAAAGSGERTAARRNPVTKPRLSRAQNGRSRTVPQNSAAVLNPPSLRQQTSGVEDSPLPLRPLNLPDLPDLGRPAPAAPSAAAPSAAAPSAAPASGPAPASAPDVPGAGAEAVDDRGPEQKLLDVLHNLDLSDVPVRRERREVPTERLLELVDRGHWLALQGNDGGISIAKVAWVNSRRTVVLLVRHPDRRALSLRMDELRQRAEEGRAYLLLR